MVGGEMPPNLSYPKTSSFDEKFCCKKVFFTLSFFFGLTRSDNAHFTEKRAPAFGFHYKN
jgi:hypothetical protein